MSSLKILAVTLPEVSTLPTSATTRRASSTQRRRLMNCSEQISVAQRRTAALLLHARCRDVAPKDLPSARFDSGTAKTVHANVTGQWIFQKSSAPNQGQSAALVSWSPAPYPPTRCRWPVPARHLLPFLPLGRAGASTQFANDVDMAPRFWELIAHSLLAGIGFRLAWFAATSAPISLSDLPATPVAMT